MNNPKTLKKNYEKKLTSHSIKSSGYGGNAPTTKAYLSYFWKNEEWSKS